MSAMDRMDMLTEAHRRIAELEAEAAGLREALLRHAYAPEGSEPDHERCWCFDVEEGKHDARCLASRAALATDAGKAVLERLRELDGIETALAKLAVDYTSAVERAEKTERERDEKEAECQAMEDRAEEFNEAAELARTQALTEMRDRIARIASANWDDGENIAAAIRALPLEEGG